MIARLPSYSTFFSTLYDESGPRTDLGRGTHHSVLRSVQWFDTRRNRLPAPEIHHLAVIWDEDHDTRVVDVLEHLHLRGLLGPIAAVGENKGNFNVLLHANYCASRGTQAVASYLQRLDDAVDGPNEGDKWMLRVGKFAPHPSAKQTRSVNLIDDDDHRIGAYLAGIDSLWGLGSMPWRPRPAAHTPFDECECAA